MVRQLGRTLAVLALAALCSAANAVEADAPGRAGRISLVQGQVLVSSEVGSASEAALLNWPLTTNNQISTPKDGRAEFRVGSTAVRLDGDSAMDVVLLDDDNLQLRLHYGSASIRVRNAELARGFELSTPQGRVRLQDVATFRVDVDRRPDTTMVNVFDGAIQFEGGGASLSVRAGRRAELQNEELHTGLAVRDGFDDWSALRDQRDDRVSSTRYVSLETTGYEELDQYGSWATSAEYGPIWMPRLVAVNWTPYRDGRWAWVAPWGWTWVDNAPWGYAPFHYGRWVMVGKRWCWAPGRVTPRPVWAPALVGWVGGSDWQLSFNFGGSQARGPATGWYPLSPREAYVPAYRVRPEHVRQFSAWVGDEHRTGRGDRPREDWRDGQQHIGITVVPANQFGNRGSFVVPTAPKALVQPMELRNAPRAAAPVILTPSQPISRTPSGRPELRPESSDGRRHGDRPEEGRRDSDQRPMPRNEVPVAPRPGTRQEPRTEQRIEPRTELKYDPRPENRQEPRTENRPEQRGEQRAVPPLASNPTPVKAASAPVVMPPPVLRHEPERAQPAPRITPAIEAARPAVEVPRAAPEHQQRSEPKQEKPEKQEKPQRSEKKDKTDLQ